MTVVMSGDDRGDDHAGAMATIPHHLDRRDRSGKLGKYVL
jgi:hypothetical protein